MRYKFYRGFRRCMETLRSRSVAISLLASLVMLIFFKFITSLNLFVIFDGDTFIVHKSYVSDAEAALAEAGIQISRDDFVFLPDAPRGGVVEIHIERSHTVFIDVYGEVRRLSTLGDTVGDALARAGLTPGGQDVVEPDVATPVENGMEITVWRKETRMETLSEEIPFETERVADGSMLEGKEEVAQEGSPGEKTYYYEISLRNGSETERRLIDEEVSAPPQNTVIRFGTKKPEPKPSVTVKANPTVIPDDDNVIEEGGTLITPSGEELRYTKRLKVTATAYTTEGQRNKLTASGTKARVGAIAVDPRVIPLGTKVYVEVPGGKWYYGLAVCEDTGGSIKGYIIDLFFNTESECWSFGRRPAIVYILD